MQGGVVLKFNLPIEKHAAKVYMRTLFEKFGEMMYHAGSYELLVLEPRRKYVAQHVNSASIDRWCKVEFKIDVSENEDSFFCECGGFEHSGIICSHALKVDKYHNYVIFCNTYFPYFINM